MTGYQSKKAAAQDKLAQPEPEYVLPGGGYVPPIPLAQPAQEPASVTYNEVADTMNALRKGNLSQKAAAEEVGKLKLYTAPPQRTWVEPSFTEWFEWWRVSAIADITEAEIDFGDFLIIAQAVVDKLKETNK